MSVRAGGVEPSHARLPLPLHQGHERGQGQGQARAKAPALHIGLAGPARVGWRDALQVPLHGPAQPLAAGRSGACKAVPRKQSALTLVSSVAASMRLRVPPTHPRRPSTVGWCAWEAPRIGSAGRWPATGRPRNPMALLEVAVIAIAFLIARSLAALAHQSRRISPTMANAACPQRRPAPLTPHQAKQPLGVQGGAPTGAGMWR
jgi:hypothetical protein